LIIIGFTSHREKGVVLVTQKQKTMKQRAILFFFIGIMTGILQAQTLTLKDAGQLFLKQNLSLIAARYDMDIAQAQVLQARLFENPVISLEQNV
jgi:cobalt-zinc-cadmium efflux system outer membrane protein